MKPGEITLTSGTLHEDCACLGLHVQVTTVLVGMMMLILGTGMAAGEGMTQILYL